MLAKSLPISLGGYFEGYPGVVRRRPTFFRVYSFTFTRREAHHTLTRQKT